MKNKRSIGRFALLLCTVFCVSVSAYGEPAMLYTTLDILRPAQVNFLPNTESVLIVNNSAVQPANLGHASLSYDGEVERLEVETDSLALFCISVLADELANKDYFRSVYMVLNTMDKNPDFNTIRPLQNTTIKDLCSQYGVDAVIALNRIKVKDEIEEYVDLDAGAYIGVLEAKYETLWSIHYPNKPEVSSYIFKDSLYWETESYVRNNLVKKLPERKNALIDGAMLVGENAAKRFTPYWEQEDRYFFNPNNKQMRQGMDSVYVKKWEPAILIWKEVLQSTSNKRLKAQAANNIAIAYEVIGDYSSAVEYANQSFNLFISTTMPDLELLDRLADYIAELTHRKEEILLLEKQLL